MEEFSPYLKEVLREMCRRVKFPMWRKLWLKMDKGWDYFRQDSWFHDYSWSKKEEKDFIKWMTNYLYTNNNARRDLLTTRLKRKKSCKTAAEQFVWNYGWKYDEHVKT